MREILFRGKRVDNGKWVYGFYIENETFSGSLIPTIISIDEKRAVRFDSEGYNAEVFVTPETVGQYTGLKDVYGTRIFEGDVVKSIAAWYVVEFENGGYGLRPFGKGKLIPIMGHGNFNENEVEVIGNIHDNPELLEVEEHE